MSARASTSPATSATATSSSGQKHWTVHLAEYFDYFFKDAPKPEWMEKGVPYLEKGKRDVSVFYKKSTDGRDRD